jgi:AraC-like DNA-binding protein
VRRKRSKNKFVAPLSVLSRTTKRLTMPRNLMNHFRRNANVGPNDAPLRKESISPTTQTRTETNSGSEPDTAGMMEGAFEEEALVNGFSVACLARARGISRRQLERNFYLEYGECPRESLQKIRMALAIRRLLSDAPIKQIAAELRYYDAAHFAHSFRHFFAESPAQMRSKLRKKLDRNSTKLSQFYNKMSQFYNQRRLLRLK